MIDRPDVKVEGGLYNPLGIEIGITVNGTLAVVDGDRFVASHVLLEDEGEGVSTIKATAVDVDGTVQEHSVIVYADTLENFVTLTADAESGISPFETTLSVEASFEFSESSISYAGPGVVEYLESSSHAYVVEITGPGLYYFTAEVIDYEDNTYNDTIAILVLDQITIDGMLRQKWENMRQALSDSNITCAVKAFSINKKDAYEEVFQEISVQLSNILPAAQTLELLEMSGQKTRYIVDFTVDEDGQFTTYSTYIIFELDTDGIWKIDFF
jgi:hypothetical protein